MDILLINSALKKRTGHSRSSPPLGLGYIASVLLNGGYKVAAIDFNVSGFSPLVLERTLMDGKPRILGISSHTKTYNNALEIAGVAKRVDPDITVVIGGPHATVMADDVAREENIDIVARGEGEYTMLDLADCLIKNSGSLTDVAGITYVENGSVINTAERSFIKDPDELPFPARHLFPIPLYDSPGIMLMSRGGCPFKCRFCAVNNIWKGKRRFRNPQKVLEEIAHIGGTMQIDVFEFADDTFTLDRAVVTALCDRIKNEQNTNPIHWTCATRVDLVDRQLLETMFEAGCFNIQFGIEAGSQSILDSIGKGITLKQIRGAVNSALDVGMSVICGFMFPHPYDTGETIRQQIRFMKELRDAGVTVNLSSTAPYPGTYYYNHADDIGIKILASSWDEYDDDRLMITTRYLSREELESIREEIIQDLGAKLSG